MVTIASMASALVAASEVLVAARSISRFVEYVCDGRLGAAAGALFFIASTSFWTNWVHRLAVELSAAIRDAQVPLGVPQIVWHQESLPGAFD